MLMIQIIFIVFFLFAIYKVVARYRAQELTFKEAVLWVVFWIGAGVIVITPNSTFYFAHLFGITRGADLVVYSALALIFFIIFKLMIRIEKLQRDITLLTRKKTLDEVKSPKQEV